MPLDAQPAADMHALLERQKAAHLADPVPSAETREGWIDRAIALLVEHGDALGAAMSADFGHRSKDQSDLTDIASSIGALKHSKKHIRKWMKTEKRSVEFPLGLLGSKARVMWQPKGVIGVISPWNFPVNLTFAPLANVFAAGNRAMVKPSEFTEATSALMQELVAEYFEPEVLTVVTGGPETGAEFTALPFDHIVFTGATSIAHHVMRAAADNLVPLTLELGGKSPAILGESADMDKAAARIMAGKTMNAGQICLAPDYALVPDGQEGRFVEAAGAAVSKMFPDGLKDNDDYTSVVNQRHFDRLNGYLEDAREKGARVVALNPADEDFRQQPHHKIPPTLVLDPTDEMTVMQDEIFGPILPVKRYSSAREAVDYVNSRPRPLGLYYFGQDKAERDMVLTRTTSGGATVNDVIFHVAQEDLPFGGIGPSGMGRYHGEDGFREFSHPKAVYTQTGSELLAMMRPPYGDKFRKQVKGRLKA